MHALSRPRIWFRPDIQFLTRLKFYLGFFGQRKNRELLNSFFCFFRTCSFAFFTKKNIRNIFTLTCYYCQLCNCFSWKSQTKTVPFEKWLFSITIFLMFHFYLCWLFLSWILTDCIFFKTLLATIRAWLKALVATNDLFIWTPSFWGTSPKGLSSFIWLPTHSKYSLLNMYWLLRTVNIFW